MTTNLLAEPAVQASIDTLTREIYWSPNGEIGALVRMSTYVCLFLALGIAGWGIRRHWQAWRIGKDELCFDRPAERLGHMLKGTLAQWKVLRKRRQRERKLSSYAAWMHGLIFYGFLALVFGTTIVALEEYGIISLYHGRFYAFVTVLCEAGGLALGAGLLMGISRRQKKPAEYPHSSGMTILYALLLLLTVQGFLLEAIRLAVQENPPDGIYSFVGYGLAKFGLAVFGKPSPEATDWIYASLWAFHMATTMGFIAVVPFSRAMHIVTSTLNLYTERLEPKVVLPPLDLTDEDAEYFGPKTIRDFTWKDLLSFDSCTECRRCTDICPANAVGKTLDPRAVILKLRDSMRAEFARDVAEPASEENGLYESGLVTHDEIWACTNCGGCVSECPVGIDQMRTIMQLRRYQTLSLGEVPQAAAKAIENVVQHGNPWGVSAADRMNWAKELDVPVITGESPKVEWLYWVGCAGAYDPSNQGVTKAVIKVLKAAGVSFAVMGKAESCSGEPVKRLGDEYNFSEIARSNVENLKGLKFDKLVTHCPHCFNTLKNDYKEYGGDFEVHHHSQLIARLATEGKLDLSGGAPAEKVTATYHDPCFLGRHNGEYESPRQLLAQIPDLAMTEMTLSREVSSCCGMGGGNMWFESAGGDKQIADERLSHVGETGAKKLVTGCSFCLINFKGALGRNTEQVGDLEVVDIAQEVARRLS